MYLIKVAVEGKKSPYWVALAQDCVAIQRSKARATVFETFEEALRCADNVGRAHTVEIVRIPLDINS